MSPRKDVLGKAGMPWLFFALVLILSLPFFYVLGATGKIVEHWDVLQAISGVSKNENGLF